MSMENPDLEKEKSVAEEDPTKKIREQIVGTAFGNLENVKQFMNERYSWFGKMADEEKDKQAEEQKEGFAECLDLKPRFGSEEEYLERVQEEMGKLSSQEKKLVFLQGLTDFKRNSYQFKSVHDRLEKADETKEPPELKPTDEILVRGLLLRSIMDASVMDENVGNDVRLAKRLEEATNKKILEDFRQDYQRMLNEGKGWGINGIDSLQLMTDLNQAGMSFKWSQNTEGKKVFSSETEQKTE